MIKTNEDKLKSNIKKSQKVQKETAEYYVAELIDDNVLEIYISEPQRVYSYQVDDDIWADFSADDELVGWTIQNATKYDLDYLYSKIHSSKFVWDIQRFLNLLFKGVDLV